MSNHGLQLDQGMKAYSERYAQRGYADQETVNINDVFMRHLRSKQSNIRPKEPLTQVGVFYACLRFLMEAVAGMVLMVSDMDDQIIEAGPVVNLFKRPNPKQRTKAFIKKIVAQYICCGGSILVLDSAEYPTEVYAYGYEFEIKPDFDAAGEITVWRLQRPNGVEEIDPARVVTFISEHPISQRLKAIAPMKVASSALDQVHGANLANQAALKNGYDPGLTVSYPGDFTTEQINDLRTQHHENAGVENNKRMLVLTGGATVDYYMTALKDMEFSVLISMNKVDICGILGVGPSCVGIYADSNYAHAEAEHEHTYESTIFPLASDLGEVFTLDIAARIQNSLNFSETRAVSLKDHGHIKSTKFLSKAKRRMVGYTAPSFYRAPGEWEGKLVDRELQLVVWLDGSDLDITKKIQFKDAEKADNIVNTLMVKPGAFVEAHDLPYPVEPWMDQGWRQLGRVPIDEPIPGDSDPSGEVTEEDEELFDDLGDQDDDQQDSSDAPGSPEQEERTKKARKEYHSQWRKSWVEIEQEVKKKIHRHNRKLRRVLEQSVKRHASEIDAQRDQKSTEVLKLRKGVPDKLGMDQTREFIDVEVRTGDAELIEKIIQPLLKEKGNLWKVLVEDYSQTYRLGGTQVMDEIAAITGEKAQDFIVDSKQMRSALKARRVRIQNVEDVTLRRVKARLIKGFRDNQTPNEIARSLAKEHGFSQTRAANIAMTEVGGVLEEGGMKAREDAGVELKSWIHSAKEQKRPHHLKLEQATASKPIKINENFTLVNATTGVTSKAPYPRHNSLPAAEAVNCGCTIVSRFPGDDEFRSLEMIMARGIRGIADLDNKNYGEAA